MSQPIREKNLIWAPHGVVKILMENADLNVKDRYGRTGLINDHSDVVKVAWRMLQLLALISMQNNIMELMLLVLHANGVVQMLLKL